MAYSQRDIVLIDNPFGRGSRPVLVVSNHRHPFHGQQYTFAVITTTHRPKAVELTASDLSQGRLHKYPSYVNPWSLHEIDHQDVHKRVAELTESKQQDVEQQICRYVEVL